MLAIIASRLALFGILALYASANTSSGEGDPERSDVDAVPASLGIGTKDGGMVVLVPRHAIVPTSQKHMRVFTQLLVALGF
jgi:hypothetical protein